MEQYERNNMKAKTGIICERPRGHGFKVAVVFLSGLLALLPCLARAQAQNPAQAAILHRYAANSVTAFPTGSMPYFVAFDRANMWVTNYSSGTVTKLRANDGLALGTYNVQNNPAGLAFDGSNIWVANHGSNSVSKLQASTGALLGNFPVQTEPFGVAFDGSAIWVANSGSSSVTKLAINGSLLGNYTVGSNPMAVLFDGNYIWVTSIGTNTVTR
jgi:YVTN family beta-propeller protein